jgi:hypothetical protein
MLIRNGSNIGVKARLTGAYAGLGFRDAWIMGNALPRVHGGGFSKHASAPIGYINSVAYVPAQTSGGLASTNRTTASASSDVALSGLGDTATTTTAAASSDGDLTGLKEVDVDIAGSVAATVSMIGRGNIGANLNIGSIPSADDFSFALLDTFEVRSGVTVRQALRRAMEGAENAFAVSA